MNKIISYSYGVILCSIIGVAALFLSSCIPLGAVAIAIILGIVVGNFIKPGKKFKNGIKFSEKHILSFAIALMGINLNFLILKELGYRSILLVITALFFTITVSLVLSKIFSFDKKFTLLLGIGNGVCGSSAIAATEKIIGANEEEVGLSIAIVNFLGTIGIFLLPFIAAVVLRLSDINSGVLVGNTLQAVGQVVAAGFSISDSAGQTATIIKMTRILMLFPIVFILIFIFTGKSDAAKGKIKKPAIPIFIIGFVLFSIIPTFGLISEKGIKIISSISHYSLIIAMAGIGLKITVQSILKEGKSALAIGSLIFFIQVVFSSMMVFLFF